LVNDIGHFVGVLRFFTPKCLKYHKYLRWYET
jgi:hypothetical protein